MIPAISLVVLLIAAPVCAQSRLYTNADLGQPLTWTRTVTPDELQSLAEHQFQAPPTPTRPTGPWVTILPHDPTWPFRTSTLDDIGKPLAEPWSMTTYVGRGFGRSGSSHARLSAPRSSARPGIHLLYP
jgi:hypothetical protein